MRRRRRDDAQNEGTSSLDRRRQLLLRPGVAEVFVGVPLLALLLLVAVSVGAGPSSTPPEAVTPASPLISSSAPPESGPTRQYEPLPVDGEIGSEGVNAERGGTPTVRQLTRRMARLGLVKVDSPPASEPLTFNVASFNVLGASHTSGPDRRPRFAGFMARLPGQVRMLQDKNISVAGLQEFQAPQIRAFQGMVGERYDVYPGVAHGVHAADNSIIWRTADWQLVEGQTTNVPYFRGRMKPMPQVLLQHRVTGHRVWIGNFHNPANVAGPAARWRAQAVSIEAALARRLGGDGTPVIMTGDMNDRAVFACAFTQQSGMHSADGARHDPSQGCVVPRRMNVDWVLGSPQVQFANFLADFSTKQRLLSDHPMISTTATLSAALDAKKCQIHPSTEGAVWFCPK